MEFTNPPLIIDGVPQSFLDLCDPVFEVYTDSPISSTDSRESLATPEYDKVDRTRLTNNYPDAYSDTFGLRSRQGFIFKTGPAWPRNEESLWPTRRELRPVNDHPITHVWDDILTRIETLLKKDKLPFTAVMPLGFANVGEGKPFCPLVVAIGVEPTKVAFKDAKAVAESVKLILAEAGFDDVEVAVWEFETFLSGLNLPALDLELYDTIAKFHHPFTSTLGIPVGPLKQVRCEGSLGLFLTRGDGTQLLALTAAHVARPPSTFSDNKGLSLKAGKRRYEEIIALGDDAYVRAITNIQNEVRNLIDRIQAGEMRISSLQTRLDNGEADADGEIGAAIISAQRNVRVCKFWLKQLYKLYRRVTLNMPIPSNCRIGRVVFADPIRASCDGPEAYTWDWAVIAIRKDAFGADFKGNAVYIGDKLDATTFLDLMFPNPNDQEGDAYPLYGLLQISGVVPLDEIRRPEQLNAMGEPAMAVIKNGRSTGTTVGWMSSLKSLVRYYDKHANIQFTSRDLTVIPYDGDPLRSGFSGEGDSGSVIVERSGRVVALLTAGGGRSGVAYSTDVTFATAYCELEQRIKEVFPGIRLLD